MLNALPVELLRIISDYKTQMDTHTAHQSKFKDSLKRIRQMEIRTHEDEVHMYSERMYNMHCGDSPLVRLHCYKVCKCCNDITSFCWGACSRRTLRGVSLRDDE